MKNANVKNIKLVLEYVGTNYAGFQRQKNGLSIQQVLEDAIKNVTGEDVTTYPSGRTDAGVHALGQVVNFFTSSSIMPEKLAVVINQHLPSDIRIISSCQVPEDFNARKSAKSKTYIYKIVNERTLSVFYSNRALAFGYNLNFEEMNKAAKLLIGTHDFSSFVSTGSSAKTTTRTIYNCAFEREGNNITFSITGNGFLYNMVRIVVGTLLDVGTNKITIETLKEILQGGKRNKAGKTVSPCGLYLKEVNY